MRIAFGGFCIAVLFMAQLQGGTQTMMFYVSLAGKDSNPGTQAAPFASLERAREAVREAVRTASPGEVVVELGPGVHRLSEPLEFTEADSGPAPDASVIYRAAPGAEVRIVGSRSVTGWKLVKDPGALSRLEPSARGKVFQADLKAQGITDFQGINSPKAYESDPGVELFFQDRAMTLARYPNEGHLWIAEVFKEDGTFSTRDAQTLDGKFVCDDPRPARWINEKEVWLHGFWFRDWRDLRIPLGSVDPEAHTIAFPLVKGRSYSVRKGQWFYAENVLVELDTPGEWYLDRDTGILYFWPPAPLSSGSVEISMTRDLLHLENAANITFRGVIFETCRGSAALVKGGSNVRFVACTFRNVGKWAMKVYGGAKHGVVGCDIYQTGQGGIHLEGGDRKTLVPAAHYADNNHIHHTSRWDPVYQQAIALYGVGNRATHNLIDNVPHIAIGFSHNDHVIEYNEIHSSVFQSNDAGAIYTSPPNETWSMRGHRIRFNYLHNIHGFESRGCNGVYLDDCFSSADIYGNIFYDVYRPILIGGGRDNPITNNMFINCTKAFHIDARGLGWAKGVGNFATKELISLNYQQPPWSVRYPELHNLLEDEPLAPKGNVVARNICWGGDWGWIDGKAAPLTVFEDNLKDEDPRFARKPPKDFALKPDSPAWMLGFRPIPFAKIGLYESPDRASWPVTSILRHDLPPPAPKPKPTRKPGPKPRFDIPRKTAPIIVDGKLTPGEWLALDTARGMALKEGVFGEKVSTPSTAWLMWDDEALYVAFDNMVSKNHAMEMGDAWGSNDAVEVSISNPALGKSAPIMVFRGFACGAFVSSDEAGAPADVVAKAGKNVTYAATVIDKGRWVAEMRIPFASLGFVPDLKQKYPFNLAVRKQGDNHWVLWRGTGDCTWYLPEAGLVVFAR